MKLSASSSFEMFWEEGSVFLRSRRFRLIFVFFTLTVASQAPFLPEQDLIIAREQWHNVGGLVEMAPLCGKKSPPPVAPLV